MHVDPEELRRYYESLSDDALLAVESNDLAGIAGKYQNNELSRRGLSRDPLVAGASNSGGEIVDDTARLTDI